MESKNLPQKEHKIILENRKKVTITGIEKMESVNTTQVALITNQTQLIISGTELHINKMDVGLGNVEIVGNFDSIKYADKKQNIFKRMFK